MAGVADSASQYLEQPSDERAAVGHIEMMLGPEAEATEYLRAGKFADARTVLEAAQSRAEFNTVARIALLIGQAYAKRKQYAEAAEMMELARLAYEQSGAQITANMGPDALSAATPADRAAPAVPASEDTAPDSTPTRVPE